MAGENSFKALFNSYSELPINVGCDVNYIEFGKHLLCTEQSWSDRDNTKGEREVKL